MRLPEHLLTAVSDWIAHNFRQQNVYIVQCQ